MNYPIKHAAIRQGGIVYVGHRHFNCFAVMRECGISHIGAEQGFIDGSGQFHSRAEALKIAEFHNQIIDKYPPYDKLMSEDMY